MRLRVVIFDNRGNASTLFAPSMLAGEDVICRGDASIVDIAVQARGREDVHAKTS